MLPGFLLEVHSMAQISLLLSDISHPVKSHLERWIQSRQAKHEIELCKKSTELSGGDFLFLISCQELVRLPLRERYRFTLVLHASDLPKGRGMSPHVWQVIEGKNEIVLSLLNAEDIVDSGDIWKKHTIHIEHTDLWSDIDERIFDAELQLMDWAIEHCDKTVPNPQSGKATYYPRRKPEDSQIDPFRSIADTFNAMRIANPHRYPAWFELHGQRYKITLEKLSDENSQS